MQNVIVTRAGVVGRRSAGTGNHAIAHFHVFQFDELVQICGIGLTGHAAAGDHCLIGLQRLGQVAGLCRLEVDGNGVFRIQREGGGGQPFASDVLFHLVVVDAGGAFDGLDVTQKFQAQWIATGVTRRQKGRPLSPPVDAFKIFHDRCLLVNV